MLLFPGAVQGTGTGTPRRWPTTSTGSRSAWTILHLTIPDTRIDSAPISTRRRWQRQLRRRMERLPLLRRLLDENCDGDDIIHTKRNMNGLLSLRGGAESLESDGSLEEEEDDDDDDDVDEEGGDGKENGKPKESREEASPSSSSSSSTSTSTSSSSSSSLSPVKVTIINSLTGSVLLDDEHPIELPTVHRHRTIASIKLSISRQLPSKPPVEVIQLTTKNIASTSTVATTTASSTTTHLPTLRIKHLSDDTLVEDLMEDEEDDDYDEQEDENDGNGLVLYLDMIPTVDPKFGSDLEKKIPDVTTAELLQAYTWNEAAVFENAAALQRMDSNSGSSLEGDNMNDDTDAASSAKTTRDNGPVIAMRVALRNRANRIRSDLEQTVLSTSHARSLLVVDRSPSSSTLQHQQQQQKGSEIVEIKGQRIRRQLVGASALGSTSSSTSWRSMLQHNLNIDWADSIRNFLLFLFFGWFGGRTATSRAILLLGAPSVFVLQARPVKLLIRQLFYALFDQPPVFFLSLLPAPQQAILSLNMRKAMHTLYGEHIRSATASRSTSAPTDTTWDEDGDDQQNVYDGNEDEDDNAEDEEENEMENNEEDERKNEPDDDEIDEN